MTFDAREKSTYQGAPIETYRFVAGAQSWHFTSSDDRISIDVPGVGVRIFEPERLSRTEPEYSQEDQSGSLKVSLPRLNAVAVLLMAGLPATPVSVTIYRSHEGEIEIIPVFVGKVVLAVFAGPNVELTVAPISEILKRKIPRLAYQKLCNWALYSQGCGVSRATYTDIGTVSSVSGITVQAAIFATRADGWYEVGYLERPADGSRQWVIAHVGNTVTLQRPFLGLTAGEAIKGIAGCKLRELEDCTTKFNNKANFLGFPRIPIKNPYELGMS